MHDALPLLEVGREAVHGGRPVAPLALAAVEADPRLDGSAAPPGSDVDDSAW